MSDTLLLLITNSDTTILRAQIFGRADSAVTINWPDTTARILTVSDSTVLRGQFALKVNYTDTTGMSNRILARADSAVTINWPDTTDKVLTVSDSTVLRGQFALKVNYTDTTGMSNRILARTDSAASINWPDTTARILTVSDSTVLRGQFAFKVNYTDTTGMSNRILARTDSSVSINWPDTTDRVLTVSDTTVLRAQFALQLADADTGALVATISDTAILSAGKQPIEATLTDIADGTIAENLVNTANPWAENEVANTLARRDCVSVNGTSCTNVDLDNATPAAPAGGTNVKWQKDASTPNNISAYIDWADPAAAAIRKKPVFWEECFSTGAQTAGPWTGASINSGTIGNATAGTTVDGNHPGQWMIAASTTANSGYRYQFTTVDIRLAGAETYEIIYNISKWDSSVYYMGFTDATTRTAATDAVQIYMIYASTGASATGTVSGQTYNNTATSSTLTTYTLADSTWVRGKVQLTVDASKAYFWLYDMSDAVLWLDSLSTNIPTAASREVGCGWVVNHSGVVANTLFRMDWMALYWNDRALTR